MARKKARRKTAREPAGKKPLEDYAKKRDFARTPEPGPELPEEGPDELRAFVVHRHEARRLHYDLRLERGGVLLSWAVPKGFSYDPADRHLAVRTEDHPLGYTEFSGVIPRGEYGAGTMTIWDRGHYRLLNEDSALERGEFKILLYGRRLRGEWHLVRTKQADKSWLLFKSRDRYAGVRRDSALGVDLAAAVEVAFPRSVRRMESGKSELPFSDPGWLFEAKFEGRRLLASKKAEKTELRGLRRRIPGVLRDLALLRAGNALLDGVLLAMDENGRPSREVLEERLSSGRVEELVYYAFDLLYVEEYDLRPLSQLDRKAALRALIPPVEHVFFLDHVPGNGLELYDTVAAAGLPALVAKRADATYGAGPSGDWVEIPVVGEHRRVTAEGGEVAVDEALERVKRERGPGRVKFSNLDKLFWPVEGFTKGDLIRYYEAVADTILPYLRDRPVHLNRYPDGIEGKSFYQKDAKSETPEWIRTVDIASRHRGEGIRYMVCDERDTLLYIANLGSIDLHPWMSRVDTPDSPDWAVIDLDPKEAPFNDVVRIAREVGRVLRGIGLHPSLKTSGASGLHVFLGLEPGYTYEQATLFCESVARIVARDLPEIATVERSISQREGKVYIDFGQNRKGQTVVPPYVPRPVRGATVSTPLNWDELEGDLHPSHHTIQTVPERLAAHGDLFRPVLTRPESLAEAIGALEEYLRTR